MRRCGNVRDRSKQYLRVILRWNKPASHPKLRGLDINSVDDQRASADELGGCHAALQRVLEQACTNSFADPILICRQLSQQQAGDRSGRLAGADWSRESGWQNGGGGESVVADDSIGFMNDKHRRKALLLVGKRARFQPAIKLLFCHTRIARFRAPLSALRGR
jgi:hypothetical protein